MMRPPSPPARICAAAARQVLKTAVQVDADEPVPEIGAQLGDGLPVAQAGVGDDDVEAAHARDRLRHQVVHRVRVGDVGGDQRGASPERLDLVHAALALVADGEVVDDDVGPVCGEHARDPAADRAVARGARDHGHAAGQRAHSATSISPSTTLTS